MTNDEITATLTAEWLAVLSRLWTAAEKQIEPDRLRNYQRELGEIPLEILDRAVSLCIRENIYNNVPTVGKLWQAVYKVLGTDSDYVMQAIEHWETQRAAPFIIHFQSME